MVGIDWQVLVEALGEAEETRAALLPYSDEPTTEDDEPNIDSLMTGAVDPFSVKG